MFGKRSEATAVKTQATPAAPKKEETNSFIDASMHSTAPAKRRNDEPSE